MKLYICTRISLTTTNAASTPALAVPVTTQRANSAGTRRRQERTPARPTSALERGQRASAGALSQPVHGKHFFVQALSGSSTDASAPLRRPSSAAALVTRGRPADDTNLANHPKEASSLSMLSNAPVASTSLPARGAARGRDLSHSIPAEAVAAAASSDSPGMRLYR